MERNKGSYKRMRELVLDQNLYLIEDLINEPIQWICPKHENGRELQLNGKDTLTFLGLPKDFFLGFWPQRSPQWDGMFIAKQSKTLYLIEAKSYLAEIKRGNKLAKQYSKKQEDNYNMKCNSLRSLMNYFKVEGDSKEDIWLHKYYQISNRIAFHLKIKEMIPNEKINNVKLVFLNFVNDPDWISVGKHASSNDWEKKYNTIFNEMGVTKEQFTENEVFIWNVDASRLKR